MPFCMTKDFCFKKSGERMTLMKAVIMAGGEGTRLRPLTCGRPKPMVPVANKPVMEHIVNLLKKHGFSDILVTLLYMPEKIKEYFGDGADFGVNMSYFVERVPLGTAGSVKNAEDYLKDTFVVISGDALTDLDISKALDFHRKKGAFATLVLKRVNIPLEYGVVVTNEDGRIIRFLEKPSWSEVFSDTVNTGIYILSPEVFGFYKKGEVFDFSKDLFPLLLKEGKPLYGFVTDDYWCDIGDLNTYRQANYDVLDGKVDVMIPGREIKKGVWVDETTEIEEGTVIEPPCLIGANNRIKRNAHIGGYTSMGDNNTINSRASIKRGIIWNHCFVDEGVQLRGSVICDKVHLKSGASVFENSVVGDESLVSEDALVKPNVKVWPGKLIDMGTEVNYNMVWGSKFSRSLFGNRGIVGQTNVDISPEFVSRLGAAYGSVFKGKAAIGVSCDDSNPASMLKTSIIAGLQSSGLQVCDLGKMPLPAARNAVRFFKMDGGIHLAAFSPDGSKIFIGFLDKSGGDIDRSMERKVENAFIKEDFKRCEGKDVKQVTTVPDYGSYYLRNIINGVESKDMDYKILITSRSEYVTKTMGQLLGELGCRWEGADGILSNGENGEESLKAFAGKVREGGFDLGAGIGNTFEKMLLVDNLGRVITEDMFMVLVSIITLKAMRGSTVVVPLSASSAVEKIAREHMGKIVRTKTSLQDFMGKMLGPDTGKEMLDQFIMHFDAMAGLVKILDFMSLNGYRLSDLVDMIPEIHIKKAEVECPWDAKGRVIREIMRENAGGNIETIEGVKIHRNEGWVMVLPDAEKPAVKVISESSSAEFAEELTNVYVNKIREINQK